MHILKNGNVPLNPEGSHPILMWQEMHIDKAVVSLDHDRVSDLVKQGTLYLIECLSL